MWLPPPPPRPPPGYLPPMWGAPGPSGLGALHWLHSLRHEKFMFSHALRGGGDVTSPAPPPFPVRPSNLPSSSQVKDGLTGWGTSSRRRAAGRRRRWGSRRGCRRPSRCCRRRSPRDPWDLRRKTRFGVKKGRFGSAWRFFRERGGWTRAHLPGRGRPGRLRRRG